MDGLVIQKPILNQYRKETHNMDFLIGLLAGLFIGGWIGSGIAVVVMASRSDDSCDMVIEETIKTLKDKEEES